MTSIGGYLEWELDPAGEYHENAVRVNTGRNALECILKVRSYEKVYLPYFFCDVILTPLKRAGIAWEFYSINSQLEPVFDYSRINSREAFLYINYFGLKSFFVETLSRACENLVVDNSQAFYAKPLAGIDTFYSPRKFFGVPDGGYLYCDKISDEPAEKDFSMERCRHLLSRIESGAEAGYPDFLQNEQMLNELPLKAMSNLTRAMLAAINYEQVARQRRRNYLHLDKQLAAINRRQFALNDTDIPLTYPLHVENGTGIRKRLASRKIFTPVYWPGVEDSVDQKSMERQLVSHTVYLPVDQRYSADDMERIIAEIQHYG